MAKLRPTRRQSRAVSQWGGAGQFRMGFARLSLLLVQREGEKVRERRGLGRKGGWGEGRRESGETSPRELCKCALSADGSLGSPGLYLGSFCVYLV